MRKTPTTKEHSTPRLVFTMPWRIKSFSIKNEYVIEATFNDGTQGTFDLNNLINSENAGVFQSLRDYNVFQKVKLIHGVLTWPGNIDIAPDALYSIVKNSPDQINLLPH